MSHRSCMLGLAGEAQHQWHRLCPRACHPAGQVWTRCILLVLTACRHALLLVHFLMVMHISLMG